MFSRRSFLAGTAAAGAAVGLAACGDKSNSASGGKLETLTMMAPLLSTTAPAADGKLQKAIEELVGMKLNINWVANSSYTDRATVVMASDDIPHVIVQTGKGAEFVQSANAGAYWDLTDILKDYKNLTSADENITKSASVNGKTFGIYRLRDPMRAGVTLHKDWLEKLGIAEPVTVSDFKNLLQAFTEDDPKGDGSASTGLIIPKWDGFGNQGPYDMWEVWNGVANVWKEDGGTLSASFLQEEFLEANRQMKDLIDAGFVNKDFATLDSAKWNDPFFNGQGGAIADVTSRGPALLALYKDANPDDYDKVTMVGNLTQDDGTMFALPTPGYSGMLAIPKSSVPDDATLAQVLTVLDTLSSEEGQRLLNNGIEGVNYEVDGDYAVAIEDTEEATTVQNDASAFSQLGTNSNGYLGLPSKPAGEVEQKLYEKRVAFQDADLEHAVYNPGAPYVSQTYLEQGALLDQIVVDARLKFLAGQLDEKGLTAELDRWSSSGGDAITKEMNELYAADN